MPAWTAFGWKSSSSVASAFGRSAPIWPPQPANASTSRTSATAARRGGTSEKASRARSVHRLREMRRRVTFSRNVTVSLSRTCVSHCKYCAFATHRPHLHEPAEVERVLDHAARRGVKELLVL